MGVRGLSLGRQCKHTDKREPWVVWNTCLGAQVGRFGFTLHSSSTVSMTGRRPFAFVAKESKNKHANRLVLGGQVLMKWWGCGGGGWGGGTSFGRDKAVCGQSQHRSDHLLRDVCLFACLCGWGWGESHNVSQREALLLLNFCATERPVVGNAS